MRTNADILSDTELKVKFALPTNKLPGNLVQLPVPLLNDPCLAFQTFLAEMSEFYNIGLLKTKIRQRGSGRGSAEGRGQCGNSAKSDFIDSSRCMLAKNQNQSPQHYT